MKINGTHLTTELSSRNHLMCLAA